MATTVKSPEPWDEAGDCDVPFDDLLNKISSSKQLPSLLARPQEASTKSQFCLEEWKRIPTVGRELDPSMVSALLGPSPDHFVRPEKMKGWPVSWEHKGSAFGTFGYLPHCDLVPWDQERAKAPERAWPADGAVCRLYDDKRKNKTAWKPTTWQHHGPSFPAVAPLATSLSAPALRNLQKKAKRDKESKPTELDQSLDRTRAHSVACLTAAATISSWSRQSLSSPSHASNKAMSHASHGESRMPSKASRRPSKAEKAESVPARSASKRRQSEPAWKIYGEILLD